MHQTMADFVVAAMGIIALLFLFVILTDGRYFGKVLMYWVYDRLGPAIFGSRRETERWNTLAENLSLLGDESILDVGTAVGDLPLTLAARPGFQGRLWGVDWSPRMLSAAQSEVEAQKLGDRIGFSVVDVRIGLPFVAEAFDLVICLGVLETLPRPRRVLSELLRVLKPGGMIAVSVYRGWSTWGVTLSLSWYRQQLAAQGLVEVQVVPSRRSQRILIAQKRSAG
jgi:ubiquinone/menaquinone biosynthesis C-methylase UbiE